MRSLEEIKALKPEDKVRYYKEGLERKAEEAWKKSAYQKYKKATTQVTGGGTVNPIWHTQDKGGETYAEMTRRNDAKRRVLESEAGYVPETSVQDAKNLIYGAPKRGGTVNPTISAADFYSMYDMITPQEAGTYKHYKTLGDEKKASEYLKAITPDINRRSAEKRIADTRQLAEDSTMGGLYARYMASLSSPLGAAYSLVQSARGEAIDPNSPFFLAEHTRQGQEEAFIGNSTGAAKLAKQAGLAAFDWGTQIATLGALGFGGEAMNIGNSALYGASAYAGNTKDAAERGATPTEAAGYGVIGAAAEVVTERLGFERLFKLGGMANKGAIRQVLKGILPNMASEGLEEGATEAVNLISDALIMSDRSQMAEIYNTAKAQGMSEGQAAKEAILAGVKQIGTAASVGAISGGMIAGGVAGGSRLAGRNILPENNDLPTMALPGEAEAQQAALETAENVAKTPENTTKTPENVIKSHENVVKSPENVVKSPENVVKSPENVFKKADSSDYAGKYFYEAGQRLIREEEAKRGNVDFIPGVQTYYEAGLAGILEKNIKQTAYTAITDRELLTRAYLAGSADRKADVEARLKGKSKLKGEAGVVLATEAATEAQKALAKLVADTSGAEVMLVDRIGSVEEGYKNGYYKDGRIVVALNADSFAGTLWHESIHYIKEAAPEAYEFLQQTVFQMAAEREDISVDAYMNRYREEYEEVYKDITAADVIEEMTADAFMAITKDEKGMEDMIQRLSNENPTMLEKLQEFLEKLIESLQALIKDQRFNSFSEDIAADVKQAEALRDMLANGLRYAGEQHQLRTEKTESGTGKEEKYAIKKDLNGKEYWRIETEKDIFKDIQSRKELRKAAYHWLLNGEKGEVYRTIIDGEPLEFVRISANEYVYGRQSKELDTQTYKQKMRMAPSIEDLIEHATVSWKAPDKKSHKFFTGEFLNYRGRVGIDDVIFNYVVRIGEKDGKHKFYDINLEADVEVPGAEARLSYKKNRLPLEDNIPQQEQKDNYKNITNSDIENAKFSIKQQEYEDLLAENERLRETNDALRRQFEITKDALHDPASAKKAVRKWLKKHDSKYDIDKFTGKFVALCDVAAKVKNDKEHNQVMAALQMLAEEALQESEALNTELRDNYADLISKVRNSTIRINETLKKELEYYGGYNQFRKANFGRIQLSTKNGIQIDSFFQELEESYPEFFNQDDVSTQGDMLVKTLDVIESLQPEIYNPYGYDLSGYARDAAYDLFTMFQEVQLQKPTFADKYEAKLKDARKKFREALNAQRAEAEASEKKALWRQKRKLEERYEEKREKERERNKKAWERAKEEHRETIRRKQQEAWNRARTHFETRLQQKENIQKKRREREEYRKHRRSVEKNAKTLLKWIENPTDKYHIPRDMLAGVQEFLLKIQTSDDDITLLQSDLRKAVANLKRTQDEGAYIEFDESIEGYLDLFQENFGDGVHLKDMTAAEMQALSNIVRSMKKTITDANRLVSSGRNAQLHEVAEGYMEEVEKQKAARQVGTLHQLSNFFNISMVDAPNFFKGMGETVYSQLYGGFREGFNRKITHVKEATEFMAETIDQKTIKEWRKAPSEKFEIGGKEIYLSVPQMMSLWCLMKRRQGKRHILGYAEKGQMIRGGGIKAEPNAKSAKKAAEALRSYEAVQVTESDVRKILEKLTPEQKEAADKIQKYLSEDAAAWGNETSMLLFGYEKFKDNNYFPIVSDKNYVNTTYGTDKKHGTLRSMGMTKTINKYANNPVILQDIFSVYAKHIDQMTSYNAFVPIMSDMNKFLNYKKLPNAEGFEAVKSVKQSMERVMGKGGLAYINNLMERINGVAGKDDTSTLPKMLLRNMKIASVGANLRVVIQQPMSYMRAFDVLDPKYLLGAVAAGKADYEAVNKYAPIAQWKEWGNYEMDTGRTMEQLMCGLTPYQQIGEWSMIAAAAADKLTWGRIWKACEMETKDKYPELKDEKFYKKVGERFTQVIDETQVVDSILHRSQIMRSTNFFNKMTTSFMSEPIKTYNMFRNAVLNYGKERTPENAKKMVRTFVTLTMNGIAVSAAAGIIDMMRDDDEEKSLLEKWLSAFRGDYSEAEKPTDYILAVLSSNLGDNFSPMNYIPYLRDLQSMLQGYDVVRTDFSGVADMIRCAKKWLKFAEGESPYTLNALLLEAAGSVSKVTGIPINSAKRDLTKLKDTIINHACGSDLQYSNKKLTYDVGSPKNAGMYVGMMIRAKMEGNTALATRIYNDMVNHGVDNDTIEGRIKAAEKKLLEQEAETLEEGAEAYRRGDYNGYSDIVRELREKGYTDKSAKNAIQRIYNEKEGKKEDEETFDTITENYWDEEISATNADYDMMFNAYMNGNRQDYKAMWDLLEAAGKKESGIKTAMKNRAKKAYQEAQSNGNYAQAQKAREEFLRLGGKVETLLN